MEKLKEALTFDDVLIVPSSSDVHPSKTDVSTLLTNKIKLNIPLVSSAMDTVTESDLAIKIAQLGGVGIIHKNLTKIEQAEEVKKVKKFESGMVINPVTINPNSTIKDALEYKKKINISGFPVVDKKSKKLFNFF